MDMTLQLCAVAVRGFGQSLEVASAQGSFQAQCNCSDWCDAPWYQADAVQFGLRTAKIPRE